MRSTLAGSLALSLAAIAGCGGDPQAVLPAQGTGGGGTITGAGGASSASNTSSGAGLASGSTSNASSSSGGPACPPAGPFAGAPISAPPGEWQWIPIPGAKCHDGSDTGIGVRLNPASDKVFIYFEGGGACFNGATCAISPATFDVTTFNAWKGTAGTWGIFDDVNMDNPVQDWNAVYIPYCTGDVHAGDATGVVVPGAGNAAHDFLGYVNNGLYLQRLVPTFENAKQVLVTGISAGGFGAALNYDRIASAFCPTPVVLIDDSGPPMADAYLAPCLQKKWRDLWHLDKTLPAGCPECTGPDGGGIVNYVDYLAKKWPNARLGLISATHDSVISTFYGFGADDCASTTPLTGAEYEAGLLDLRHNHMASSGLWGTYFIDSPSHTWLLTSLYTTSVDGHALTDWIRDMLDGQPSNVGP